MRMVYLQNEEVLEGGAAILRDYAVSYTDKETAPL